MALTLDKSVLDKIEALQNIMLASVTGGARDEAEYRQIRDELQNRRQRDHSLDRPPPSDCNGPYRCLFRQTRCNCWTYVEGHQVVPPSDIHIPLDFGMLGAENSPDPPLRRAVSNRSERSTP